MVRNSGPYGHLSWSGSDSDEIAKIDVFRDGKAVATNIDDTGEYTDDIDERGSGEYTYKVCEYDGEPCSNEAIVTF